VVAEPRSYTTPVLPTDPGGLAGTSDGDGTRTTGRDTGGRVPYGTSEEDDDVSVRTWVGIGSADHRSIKSQSTGWGREAAIPEHPGQVPQIDSCSLEGGEEDAEWVSSSYSFFHSGEVSYSVMFKED